MFSFLILAVFCAVQRVCRFIRSIGKNDYKCLLKWTAAVILLLAAVYLKSVNL